MWSYDYNLLQDQINSEKYSYLKDVRYVVYYPYKYSDYDAVKYDVLDANKKKNYNKLINIFRRENICA